jgi:purine nucleosidase
VFAKRRVILDTDIGSDIDDALALLLLLHLRDVEVLGVTTVYGNVGLRAKIARRILQAAGNDAPVHAGIGQPMHSRFPIWHAGVEGAGLLSDEETSMPLGEFNVGENAPAFLVEQVINDPDSVTIVCLGALTNLAAALAIEPRVKDLVKHVFFMGGGVTYPYPVPDQFEPGDQYLADPSHNARCDDEAAGRVFESGMKITVLTNDVTTRAWWEDVSVKELIHADEPPEARAVGQLLSVWLEYRSRVFGRTIRGTCPHDAMTVAEAVDKGRFVRYHQGCMTVHYGGRTTFVPDEKGPHSVATQVNVEDFLVWLAPRLLRRESQVVLSNEKREHH